MISHIFHVVTHLGDSALLIPVSLAVILLLIWSGHRDVAFRFGLAVAALMAATVALKVGFYAVGGNVDLNILSPSGHVGFSVTVYGSLAAMVARQLRPVAAASVVAATSALVAVVLASRVYLGAHTPEEVALGVVTGLLCLGSFVYRNPGLIGLRLRVPVTAVVVLSLASVTIWAGERQFNTERGIERVGILVGSTFGTLSPDDLQRNHHGQGRDAVKRLSE